MIVLDPGHAPTINAIDPATGLNVSDYENEPEMTDVFTVALLVKAKLQAAGYQVVMTKNSVRDRVDLAQRAAVANRVHAALALSIHDQAGPNGGIGFSQGNNIVYYQSVGTYRATASGQRVTFSNAALAAVSAKYGQIFTEQRTEIEHTHISLLSNTGYNLGGRGLAPGDIWMVQLLSKVPWIYNESGGNSAGMSGLNASDQQTYADSLVAAVEKCVPVPRNPVLHIDRLTGTHSTVSMTGWAYDPDATSSSVAMTVREGRRLRVAARANRVRADLDRRLAIRGRHGFAVRFTAARGRHKYCVTALNIRLGSSASRCVFLTVSA